MLQLLQLPRLVVVSFLLPFFDQSEWEIMYPSFYRGRPC
jgi:hypothetical protein